MYACRDTSCTTAAEHTAGDGAWADPNQQKKGRAENNYQLCSIRRDLREKDLKIKGSNKKEWKDEIIQFFFES